MHIYHEQKSCRLGIASRLARAHDLVKHLDVNVYCEYLTQRTSRDKDDMSQNLQPQLRRHPHADSEATSPQRNGR